MYLRLVLEGIKRGLGVFFGKYKKNEDFATKIRGKTVFREKRAKAFSNKKRGRHFSEKNKGKDFSLTNFYQNPKI